MVIRLNRINLIMGILKDILTSSTNTLVKTITEGLDSLITNKAEKLALQIKIN
jgi:hypothetical protein